MHSPAERDRIESEGKALSRRASVIAMSLNVVLVKPSKYDEAGYVERFRLGYLPNSTLNHIRSMTPSRIGGATINVHSVDEYVHCDTEYLKLLRGTPNDPTLVAFVGTQSHQFHRAADLAARARRDGCMAVIGGPHPMTCDTTELQNRGVSFALAEAETIWPTILHDALRGELEPVYGADQRWASELDPPVLIPPGPAELKHYLSKMMGVYPVRGCPFTCNFCSVIKISGRSLRSQPVETTMATLRNAKAAGIQTIIFTSDNFNKYPEAPELLGAMADERLELQFFCQCDAQIADQEDLVALMAKANCWQIFVGVESFNRQTLLKAHKAQNHPEKYQKIVDLCREYGISSHLSNIIGFWDDVEESILEHVSTLSKIGPTIASFYTLCPIPGTEQYGEFLSQGLITEKNLDRFDTTTPTWRHPKLTYADLHRLFKTCYRKFYTLQHMINNLRYLKPRHGTAMSEYSFVVKTSAFARYSAFRGVHPFSGGIGRVRLDHVNQYLDLRERTYGYRLFPLPPNLELSETDQALNRKAKLVRIVM